MKKYLSFYNHCIFCNSKKLSKIDTQKFRDNFYLKAIRSDLSLSRNFFSIMKTYQCENCFIVQNNPWFNEEIYSKIFSSIYGQHNRSWSNLFKFLKNKKKPDHGKLFQILTKKIKIKSYAEFNSPFTGLLLHFLSREYNEDFKKMMNLFKYSILYLNSRQLAGKSKKFFKISELNAKQFLGKIKSIKSKKIKNNRINKSLILDHSLLGWGQNDNYKSVNSHTLASSLMDLNILNLNENNKSKKFDLFGIFHTLDHTLYPKRILDYSLKRSKYVIIYCHANPNLEKQHLFTLTSDFLKYLKKKNLHVIDLTHIIAKKYYTKELYFLCSQTQNLSKFKT